GGSTARSFRCRRLGHRLALLELVEDAVRPRDDLLPRRQPAEDLHPALVADAGLDQPAVDLAVGRDEHHLVVAPRRVLDARAVRRGGSRAGGCSTACAGIDSTWSRSWTNTSTLAVIPRRTCGVGSSRLMIVSNVATSLSLVCPAAGVAALARTALGLIRFTCP